MTSTGEVGENGGIIVFDDGLPEVLDLVYLGSWATWRTSLQVWQRAACCRLGCLAAHSPETVGIPAMNWREAGQLALASVEALAGRCWKRGLPPRVHTGDTEKVFSVSAPMASKAYLGCVLGLPELLQVPNSSGLATGQTPKDYECLTLFEQPTAVPLGKNAASYAGILASKCAGRLDMGAMPLAVQDD